MDGFIEFSLQYLSIALCAAISSLPLCLIVGAITFACRRWMTASARFALWTLVLVRMLLPFSWETPFGLGMITNRMETTRVTTMPSVMEPAQVSSAATDMDLPNPLPVSPDAIASIPWNLNLLLLQSAAIGMTSVSFLLAAWFVVTSIRLLNRVRSGVDPQNCQWNELLERGRREFGIGVPVRLRILSGWETPATMGFFQPVIILSDDAQTLSYEEVQHVLWHELAHIKRGDAAWNFLWIAVRCLHWWNPCLWWTQYAWLTERELACDRLVLQHLDPSAAMDYGRTIIRFVERLSHSAMSPLGIRVPGLVMMVGEKRALLRRLQALADPATVETIWSRCWSFGLLAILAVMGLTDAAVSKNKTSPDLNTIMVPTGTVWKFDTEGALDSEASENPTTCRMYDLSPALARIQQDEPILNREVFVREFIQFCVSGIFPRITGKLQTGHYQFDGDNLTITATESQHRAIQKLLDQWQQFGQRQISLEVRMISTGKELNEFLPAFGGEIVSPTPIRLSHDFNPLKPAHKVQTSMREPSFVRVLSSNEKNSANYLLLADSPTKTSFAPKITLFSGQSATISDTRNRPFVTGLCTNQAGQREPQISNVTEGLQFCLSACVHDSNGVIRLEVQVQHTEIIEVELLTTKIPGVTEETAIQIPKLRQTNLQTSAHLATDETLLISPLRRDLQGKRQVYMITPRLISSN